eukprot:gene26832-41019_t
MPPHSKRMFIPDREALAEEWRRCDCPGQCTRIEHSHTSFPNAVFRRYPPRDGSRRWWGIIHRSDGASGGGGRAGVVDDDND